MGSETLEPLFIQILPEPPQAFRLPSARVEEDEDDADEMDAEPEEPSQFDDPDQINPDFDDEDLEDDDGWADEDEEY
jgi:hypothetical protein